MSQKMKKSIGHLTAKQMLSLGQKYHKGHEHARESHAVLEALLLTDLLPTSPCMKSMLTWKHSPPGAWDKQRSSADSRVSSSKFKK